MYLKTRAKERKLLGVPKSFFEEENPYIDFFNPQRLKFGLAMY